MGRLALVVSLPFVLARRDVNDSGMPENRVLSLWRDGDFRTGLRGVLGGVVSSLNLVCGGSTIGSGQVESKSAKRLVT